MLPSDVLEAIDTRALEIVKANAASYTTAIGTVVQRQSLTDAMVVFDSSQGSIPCKVSGTAAAYEGDRVYLVKHGRWWVIVGAAPYRGVYEQLKEAVVTGSPSTITFNDIPNTHRHLKLSGVMRSDAAATQAVDVRLRFNGDTSNRYGVLTVDVNNGQALGAPFVNTQNNQSGINWALTIPGASIWQGTRAGFEITIYDYTEQALFTTKEVHSVSGFADVGTFQRFHMRWGVWDPPTIQGITSIELACGAGNFVAGSRVGLWGIT